jgi:mycothiol synthase
VTPSGPASDQLVWVSPADEDTDAGMAAAGLVRRRTLVQMRRPLPVDDAARSGATPLATRTFRPDSDGDGWLRVNNAAFAWHPDQGGWDADRLAARLSEDWVALDGFLVHDGPDGTIDGFCWTRVHPATDDDPARGEIFVIAAHPDRHGTGLGRALTLAGLDHLAALGLTEAILFSEADNGPAIALYERLGFRIHHRDAGYGPGPS